MKKAISCISALLLLSALVACSHNDVTHTSDKPVKVEISSTVGEDGVVVTEAGGASGGKKS